MKAAIVYGPGDTPRYGEIDGPMPQSGSAVLTVNASALSHLSKGRASGSHYSSSSAFPFVAGFDGVGTNASGQRFYFAMPTAPFGGMAEKVLVRNEYCIALPDDVDDVTAAAIANPGMSAMAALKFRAMLQQGETVLVNGATGTAGKVAVQIARHLGARKVIATGRNPVTLEKLKSLGADVVINLTVEPKQLEEALLQQIRQDGIDVVLDYLWGPSALILLTALAKSGISSPLRYVSVGSWAGREIVLPSAVLRAIPISLMGSGSGSVARKDLMVAIREVFKIVHEAKLEVLTKVVPLADIENSWKSDFGQYRVVFVPRP